MRLGRRQRMRMGSGSTYLRWSLALGILCAGGCSCDEDILNRPNEPGACEPDFECPSGTEYRRGQCLDGRCADDLDCCPGQRCSVAVGFCGDQYLACTEDADCVDRPGQACIDFRGGMFCGYPNRDRTLSDAQTQACTTGADCEAGRVCMGRRCVMFAPCQGGCPDGQVCDIDSDTCFAEPSCEASCAEGQMLVVADPDSMSGPSCCLVECACATLPPLQTGQYGWYADIAVSDQTIAMSAFDPGFGDLVVAYYDGEGTLLRTDYVDGFPDSGSIVADPEGPRGGHSAPGPNVGEHASIAIDDTETIHMAYHDRDAGTLKYAVSSGGGWTVSTVDDTGRTGLYTSIAIDPGGLPQIAYMMAEGTLDPDPGPVTALRFARARTPLPSDPSDWDPVTVDVRPKPPGGCDGGCANGSVCVDLGAGASCVPESTGCGGGCPNGQRCVDTPDLGAQCREPLSPVELDDLIAGVGLFADLALTSTGLPVIAYYDQVVGDLRLAQGTEDGTFSVMTLDGALSLDPADVGLFASVAIGPDDRIGVAYYDAERQDLVYIDATDRFREIVDDGVTPPTLRLVGADADLVFDRAGRPAIAYQDPTQIDLLYARRLGDPPMWTQEILRGAPAAGASMGTASGFYACQDRRQDQAFVGSVDVTFDAQGALRLDLVVDVTSLD